jgi:hypothetical protein
MPPAELAARAKFSAYAETHMGNYITPQELILKCAMEE